MGAPAKLMASGSDLTIVDQAIRPKQQGEKGHKLRSLPGLSEISASM
jgi:hypothetical protein